MPPRSFVVTGRRNWPISARRFSCCTRSCAIWPAAVLAVLAASPWANESASMMTACRAVTFCASVSSSPSPAMPSSAAFASSVA